jgi:hypothetical protein
MEAHEFLKVSRTDLIRDAGEIFDSLLRGSVALIEKRGRPQAVLMDIYDFYSLRAAARYGSQPAETEPGKLNEFVKREPGEYELHVKVIGQYLAEEICLAAAELLGIPEMELKSRFLRLQIPIRGEGVNG